MPDQARRQTTASIGQGSDRRIIVAKEGVAAENSMFLTEVAVDSEIRVILIVGFSIAKPDTFLAVQNIGNSGIPGSPHYRDQFEPWLQGTYHTVALSRAGVEADRAVTTTIATSTSNRLPFDSKRHDARRSRCVMSVSLAEPAIYGRIID